MSPSSSTTTNACWPRPTTPTSRPSPIHPRTQNQAFSATGEYGDLIGEYDNDELTNAYPDYDAQWNTKELLDDTGDPTASYRNTAFGLQSPEAQPDWCGMSNDQWDHLSEPGWDDLPACNPKGPNGYGGQAGYYHDEELELYILGMGGRGRYYDPALGRFTSQDPSNLAGGDTNLYRYVNNNPVNGVDPSGNAPPDPLSYEALLGTPGNGQVNCADCHPDRQQGLSQYEDFAALFNALPNHNGGEGAAEGVHAGLAAGEIAEQTERRRKFDVHYEFAFEAASFDYVLPDLGRDLPNRFQFGDFRIGFKEWRFDLPHPDNEGRNGYTAALREYGREVKRIYLLPPELWTDRQARIAGTILGYEHGTAALFLKRHGEESFRARYKVDSPEAVYEREFNQLVADHREGYLQDWVDIMKRSASAEFNLLEDLYPLEHLRPAIEEVVRSRNPRDTGSTTLDNLAQLNREFAANAPGIFRDTTGQVSVDPARALMLGAAGDAIVDLGLTSIGNVWSVVAKTRALSQAADGAVSVNRVEGLAGAAQNRGVDLSLSRPAILNNDRLTAAERELVEYHFRVKMRALHSAARRGELIYSPGTDVVRVSELQAVYRTRVIERFERMFGKSPNLARLDADHPVDLIVGGAADQRPRMLHRSINRSIGSSLRHAAERAGLKPGDRIRSIHINGGL